MKIISDFGIVDTKPIAVFTYEGIDFCLVNRPDKSVFYDFSPKIYGNPVMNKAIVELTTGMSLPLEFDPKVKATEAKSRTEKFINHRIKQGMNLHSELDKFEKINL